MPNESDHSLAPITFLLGASTSGKTSIGLEVLKQIKENTDLEGKVKIWGQDQESKLLFDELGFEMFKDDPRYNHVTKKFSNQPEELDEILTAICVGSFKDPKSGQSLPLDDEEFNESIDAFLQNTEGKYDVQTLNFLKELAQEEKQNGYYQQAIIDLCSEPGKITKSAIDRAIRNSENGIATILDGVPLGFMDPRNPNKDYRVVEQMEEYLRQKEFNGPIQVALVHLHPNEMALRMEQRNIEAKSVDGNEREERDGLGFYEAQYSQLFGKVGNDGILLNPVQIITLDDINNIAEKFGAAQVDGEEIKIRDLKERELSENSEVKLESTLAIRSEGKKLRDAMGFEDGENSLEIGTKVRSDVIFDHQRQETSEIASEMIEFIAQNMKEIQKLFYWRDQVRSWKAANEVDKLNPDNSSTFSPTFPPTFSWANEVRKENAQGQVQNQSILHNLWYKNGMRTNLESDTEMANTLKDMMNYIKETENPRKKNIENDSVVLMDDTEEFNLKALAVCALAEADGHAPKAREILEQGSSEKRKKLKTESKIIMKPPPPEDRGH